MTGINEYITRLEKYLPLFFLFFIVLGIVLPLPVLAVDILIGFNNILLAIGILLIIINAEKISNVYFLPIFIIFSTISALITSISSVRIILINGVNFNGRMIQNVSNIVAGSENDIRLFIGFGIFVIFTIFIIKEIFKKCFYLRHNTAVWILNSWGEKTMAIETDQANGIISEDEAGKMKFIVQQKLDFLGAVDVCTKLICGNVKITLFNIAVIIGVGSTIDILLRNSEIMSAIKYYMLLSIGSGILFLLYTFLLSFAVNLVAVRFITSDNIEYINKYHR